MHVVETEPLKRCPFCGGRAFVRFDGNSLEVAADVICQECKAKSKTVIKHPDCDKTAEEIKTEAKAAAVEAWNRRERDDRRTQAEQERKVFCNSLTADEAGSMMEAVKFYQWSTCRELMFCENMARLYGCIPLDSANDNLLTFLCTLYHYGQVQGIRAERTRRKGGRQA